jgi:hypothetical protein
MAIFWMASKITAVPSLNAQKRFQILVCLVKENNYYEVSACFFETLTGLFQKRHKISVLPFSVSYWSIFPVYSTFIACSAL